VTVDRRVGWHPTSFRRRTHFAAGDRGFNSATNEEVATTEDRR